MNLIADKIQPLGETILAKLTSYTDVINVKSPKDYNNEWWTNKTFTSWNFRKASIQILNRGNIYVLHLSIFPHLDDSSPIFGFDIVSTPNKITAAFCDFSVSSNSKHPMIGWFKDQVKDLNWKKQRELPDWGKQIFSENMIAATAVNTEEEINQVIDIGIKSLNYYLGNVGLNADDFYIEHTKEAQNKYCFNQKQNTFPVKMLVSYGIKEMDAKNYFNEYLYPEWK